MRGLYSHSREYRKINSYILERIQFRANTCRACIRTRANTGKDSWQIIYVLVSCQGAIDVLIFTSVTPENSWGINCVILESPMVGFAASGPKYGGIKTSPQGTGLGSPFRMHVLFCIQLEASCLQRSCFIYSYVWELFYLQFDSAYS